MLLEDFCSQTISCLIKRKQMKTKSILAAAFCSIAAVGAFGASADTEPATKQLQIYPKNLARQHLGTNLFVFNATNQTYVPTEAAAPWLDDDVATGWPAMTGHHFYLISLAEPELLSNFCISA